MKCNACTLVSVNGRAVHEHMCPNGRKTWVPERGWVLFVKCRNCDELVEVGQQCGPCNDF